MKQFAALFLLIAIASSSRAEMFDVVVYGATPGGIAAAIAAKREGASVALIEPSKHIGGMTVGGLSRTDYGKPSVIGGIAKEFFARADAHYNDPKKTHSTSFWYSEPHVAEKTFHDMLKESGIEPLVGLTIKSVTRDGAKVTSLTTDDGKKFEGRVFIDASYEGDLMALAGVKYFVGREGRADFDESLAGFLPEPFRLETVEYMATPGTAYTHGTPAKINAHDANGKLLWGINDKLWPAPGTGDRLVQTYNFRVIATKRADIRVPFPKPKNYYPERYELLLQMVLKFPGIRFEKIVFTGEIPNGKYDVNASGLLFSTDYWSGNSDYPEGDAATRARIWQDHVDYVQGLFWFLGNDERVPKDLRDQVAKWGLAKDEFTDNGNWPYALYVREARRMIGPYVMRQQDCQKDITKPDSIAMGSFILDSHALQRLVTPEGFVIDEGNFDIATKPYQIPYRSIVPVKSQGENLLVPVCMSATHVAYGSIRMEPQYMEMGHAAGVAAMMAIRGKTAVQDIAIAELQSKLVAQKQIIAMDNAGPLVRSKLAGIVLDDEDAKFTGAWTVSSYSGNGLGGSYRHDANEAKGTKSARFETKLPADGIYEVRFGYTPLANRASNVPVAIHSADGDKTVIVNERNKPEFNDLFVSLGKFRFAAAQPTVIEINTANTDGYVIIDAVQFLPAP